MKAHDAAFKSNNPNINFPIRQNTVIGKWRLEYFFLHWCNVCMDNILPNVNSEESFR